VILFELVKTKQYFFRICRNEYSVIGFTCICLIGDEFINARLVNSDLHTSLFNYKCKRE